MLNLISVSKTFGQVRAIEDITISLAPGLVHGIVGKNGAGKTTLFNCIAGLMAFQGKIESSIGAVKEHVAFLPSTPYMMSHITGMEYLQLIANAQDADVDIASRNIFDLPLGRYAAQYSTGMMKKLAITGLLLSEHYLFLLDEPFSGVDLESNLLIQELINHLKNAGKTILISSHILNTLEDSADIIHILDKGNFMRSVEKNSFSELHAYLKPRDLNDRLEGLDI